jgi:hypothetical protein
MKPNKRRKNARRAKVGLWKEYGDFIIAVVTLSVMVAGVVKLRTAGSENAPSSAALPNGSAAVPR